MWPWHLIRMDPLDRRHLLALPISAPSQDLDIPDGGFIDGDDAVRAAHALATSYWSTYRLMAEIVLVILGIAAVTFPIVLISVTLALGYRVGDSLGTFVISALSLGCAGLFLWAVRKSCAVRAELGEGAFLWAEVARRFDRSPDIRGGWRRGLRVTLAVLAFTAAAFTTLGVTLSHDGFAGGTTRVTHTLTELMPFVGIAIGLFAGGVLLVTQARRGQKMRPASRTAVRRRGRTGMQNERA